MARLNAAPAIVVLGTARERVDRRARMARTDALGHRQRARAEHHDGRGGVQPCHFSPGTTSSEK